MKNKNYQRGVISVCCYKQHNAYVAWVSEAELKPSKTYERSVQRNTEEWLMGCRGEGGEGDTDLGQVGG